MTGECRVKILVIPSGSGGMCGMLKVDSSRLWRKCFSFCPPSPAQRIRWQEKKNRNQNESMDSANDALGSKHATGIQVPR